MNDLVDRIATGKAQLLGVEDICTRLGVSRSTFDRWVRNGGGKSSSSTPGTLAVALMTGQSRRKAATMIDDAENLTEGTIKFPGPDIRIGNAPKWEMETLKKWLRENVTQE